MLLRACAGRVSKGAGLKRARRVGAVSVARRRPPLLSAVLLAAVSCSLASSAAARAPDWHAPSDQIGPRRQHRPGEPRSCRADRCNDATASVALPPSRQLARRAPLGLPNAAVAGPAASENDTLLNEQLVELLSKFYVHLRRVEFRLEALRRQAAQVESSRRDEIEQSNSTTQVASWNKATNASERSGSRGGGATGNEMALANQFEERLKAVAGADRETLNNWLGKQRTNYNMIQNYTLEVLHEKPNRSIFVCPEPKIFVLPNVTDAIYCLTNEQWTRKLWSDLRLSTIHYPIILLNLLIFLFGTLGNIFVCLSVKRNSRLRNVTNYFIVNLAVADLLVILICLPGTVIWDIYLTWFFGTIPCKLIIYLQDVSVSVSVLTLTAISIDRYYAICHPIKFKSSLRQAKRVIILIWLLSLLIMAPDLVYLQAKTSQDLSDAGLDTVLYSDCNYNWSEEASRAFQFVKTILLYFVPFILMFCANYKILRVLKLASAIVDLDELKPSRNGDEDGDEGARPPATLLSADQTGNEPPLPPPPPPPPSPSRSHCAGRKSSGAKPDGLEWAEFRNVGGRCSESTSPNLTSAGGGAQTANKPTICANNSDQLAELAQTAVGERESCQLEATPPTGRRVRFGSLSSEQTAALRLNKLFARNSLVCGASFKSGHQHQQRPESRWWPLSKLKARNGNDLLDAGRQLKQIAASADKPINQPTCEPIGRTGGSSGGGTPTARVNKGGGGGRRPTGTARNTNRVLVSQAGRLACGSSGTMTLTMHNKSKLESRKRAAKMLTAIVILFGICYLPVHLINFLRQLIQEIPQTDLISTISMLAHCTCYLNSAINPIIYNHMNSVFRAEFRKFLGCFRWRNARRDNNAKVCGVTGFKTKPNKQEQLELVEVVVAQVGVELAKSHANNTFRVGRQQTGGDKSELAAAVTAARPQRNADGGLCQS